MRLPLKLGIPLLILCLVGSNFADGPERTLLLVAAMGCALWSAFSLPDPIRPAEPEEEPGDEEPQD